jgi:uncharacterized protein (TIGR00255 family)
MIRSMTGFGSATLDLDGGSLTVEARSVNSRHLSAAFRGLEVAGEQEAELRATVAERIQRGRVEISLSAERPEGAATRWELDEGRVQAYLEAVDVLQHKFGLPGRPDAMSVLRAAGVLREKEGEGLDWLDTDSINRALADALDALVEMREGEGARLESDLRARVAEIRERTAEVQQLAPVRLETERDRLREAVRELTDGTTLDEDRLSREIALIADRWDLGEELVRIVAHLDAFEEYLSATAVEPVGKRLSFLVQELQREINTLGAKANDTGISRHVVEMKNQLEKLREQVENVE